MSNDPAKMYFVMVEAENVMAVIDGTIREMGFFCGRVVSARNEDDAKRKAISAVHELAEFKKSVNQDQRQPIRFSVREIKLITEHDEEEFCETGLVFYEQNKLAKNINQ